MRRNSQTWAKHLQTKGHNMAHILGTPYKRGKSDIIQAYNRPAQAIEEGLGVVETSNVDIALHTGANGVCVGVMGGTEFKGASVVIAGAEVYVQLANAVNAINAATDSVYVGADGKFTNVAEGNTQVNATWVSVDGATVWNDGIVEAGANKRTNQKCACISFRGGM